MTVPKTIFFDLDNTLLDHTSAVRVALDATVLQYPAPFRGLPFEDILRAFHEINEALWKEYSRSELTPAELRRQRFETLLVWCNEQRLSSDSLAGMPVEEISENYMQAYVAATMPFDGVVEMLAALTHSRHSLGIITNGFTGAQQGKLETCGIDRFFPYVIFSEAIGVHKPDPLIFQVALRSAGVNADDALYVGDNFFHDIYGAAYAGLKTIWFNPSNSSPSDEHPRINPDAIARSIPELAQLLGVPLSTTPAQ